LRRSRQAAVPHGSGKDSMTRHLTNKEIEGKLEQYDIHIESDPESLKRASKVLVDAISKIRASKTQAKCADCGQPIEYYTLHLYGNLAEGNEPFPTQCEVCEAKAKNLARINRNWERFRSENGGYEFYCEKSTGNPPRPNQYASVQDWNGGGSDSLIAVGDSYTGKTTAIYHKIESMIRADEIESCRIVTWEELEEIPALVRAGNHNEFISELLDYELVFIDD